MQSSPIKLSNHINKKQGGLIFEANQDTNNLHRFDFHEAFEKRASLSDH
jgi:quinol monooxygenase YgiN